MTADPDITTKSAAGMETALLARESVSVLKTISAQYKQYRDKLVLTTERRAEVAHKNIKAPPKLRYFIVGYVAIGLDLLGIVLFLADITLAGAVIEGILTFIIISIPMAVFTRLMVGRRLKDAKREQESLEKDIEVLQKAFTILRQKLLRLSEYALRTSPQLAISISNAGARIVSITTKLAKASPRIERLSTIGKFFRRPLVRTTGESIPFIKLIPFWTIGIILQYKEHKNEYEAGQVTLMKYQEIANSLVIGEDAHFEAQVGEYEAQSDEVLYELASMEAMRDDFDLYEDEEESEKFITEAVEQESEEYAMGPTPYRVRTTQDINPAVAVPA